MGERLRKAGLSNALLLYDVRNAFNSPLHSEVASLFTDDAVRHCAMSLNTLMTQHTCVLEASDGDLVLRFGQGLPRGNSVA
eukprot:9547773-Alexandrium_andersonii.AAC.1